MLLLVKLYCEITYWKLHCMFHKNGSKQLYFFAYRISISFEPNQDGVEYIFLNISCRFRTTSPSLWYVYILSKYTKYGLPEDLSCYSHKKCIFRVTAALFDDLFFSFATLQARINFNNSIDMHNTPRKCGTKSSIHSQSPTRAPLKSWNGF